MERFGWDCEIIDYFVNQDNALFKRPTGLGSAAHDAHTALHYQALSERYRRFEKFSRDHLRISDRRYGRFDELAGGPLPYDLILSGSDQIWNLRSSRTAGLTRYFSVRFPRSAALPTHRPSGFPPSRRDAGG